jgi:hypothetical protein
MSELIHSDFETIERDGKTYRISTRVEYYVSKRRYECKAKLHRQRGGRIRSRDKIYSKTRVVSDKSDVEIRLEECVGNCMSRLDEVVEAKSMSVDVSISDE